MINARFFIQNQFCFFSVTHERISENTQNVYKIFIIACNNIFYTCSIAFTLKKFLLYYNNI